MVSGEEPAALEARLRALVRREFLSVEVDPRSPERGQYEFVQSVVHEVAYGTLARRDRRTRHLAAARYIDSLGDDAMATVVATHYLEAYRAAPDDEQGRVIRAQARVALRAAADRSARLHNYAQAVRDLERSLELTDDAAERAGILVQQAELNETAAHFDEAAVTAEARTRCVRGARRHGRGSPGHGPDRPDRDEAWPYGRGRCSCWNTPSRTSIRRRIPRPTRASPRSSRGPT